MCRAGNGITAAQVTTRTDYFGGNSLSIALPPFWTMYREQLVAPMFVFQVDDGSLRAVHALSCVLSCMPMLVFFTIASPCVGVLHAAFLS